MPQKKTFKNQKKAPVKPRSKKISKKQRKTSTKPNQRKTSVKPIQKKALAKPIENKISVKPTLQTHNSFFIEVFSKKEYGLDIFKSVLEPSQFELFNWKTLKSEMNIFIDKQGNEKRVDLLFSVQPKDSEERVRIFFLLEHKSHQDPNLLKQILGYQTYIYNHFDCPVIPILVYHGREKDWKDSLIFQDLIKGLTPALKKEFGKNILNFECKLLNIHEINLYDEKVKDLLTRPILLIMTSIWNLKLETVEELFRMGESLKKKDQQFLIQKVVDYICRTDPNFTFKTIQGIEKKTVSREENRVMGALQSSLDQAEEKGIKKGEKKGLMKGRMEGRMEEAQEVALRMIQDGEDLKRIYRYTGLTSKEVEKLRKKAKSKKKPD